MSACPEFDDDRQPPAEAMVAVLRRRNQRVRAQARTPAEYSAASIVGLYRRKLYQQRDGAIVEVTPERLEALIAEEYALCPTYAREWLGDDELMQASRWWVKWGERLPPEVARRVLRIACIGGLPVFTGRWRVCRAAGGAS